MRARSPLPDEVFGDGAAAAEKTFPRDQVRLVLKKDSFGQKGGLLAPCGQGGRGPAVNITTSSRLPRLASCTLSQAKCRQCVASEGLPPRNHLNAYPPGNYL